MTRHKHNHSLTTFQTLSTDREISFIGTNAFGNLSSSHLLDYDDLLEGEGNMALLSDYPIYSREQQRFAALTSNHSRHTVTAAHSHGNLDRSHIVYPLSKQSPPDFPGLLVKLS